MLPKRHVISVADFDRELFDHLYERSRRMEEERKNFGGQPNVLANMQIVLLFFQESTRTRFSFEAAISRLGGKPLSTTDAEKDSSMAKGESWEDTVLTLSQYFDGMIIRTPQKGMVKRAAMVSEVPIINAGDGAGEHPTQALLDAAVFVEQFKDRGGIDGKVIAFTGDLADSRTARSLALFLARCWNPAKFIFISPIGLEMREDVKQEVRKAGVDFTESHHLESALAADAIYHQRPQGNNRQFPADATELQKKELEAQLIAQYRERFHVNAEFLSRMRPDAFLHHPGPRTTVELNDDAGMTHPKNVMKRGMEVGMYMRMALLYWIYRGKRKMFH